MNGYLRDTWKWLIFMNYYLVIPSFLMLHIFVGKMASIPYGLVLFPVWYVAPAVIIVYDFLLVIVYNGIFELALKIRFVNKIAKKIRYRLNKLFRKTGTKKVIGRERKIHSNLLRRAQKWGQPGVIFIASIPFIGGGVWSASLLATFLKLGKIRRCLLILLGSVICCSGLTVGFFGVKRLIALLMEILK